jgi:hypothetical protein
MRMRMIAILCATLAVLGCDDDNNRSHRARLTNTGVFSPTLSVGTQIFPQTLPFTALNTIACPLAPAFTTSFDLIFATSPQLNVFMDRVTLRLIDGSSLGPSITFPRPLLNSMFGSTLIVSNRAFPFQPNFGCGLTLPRGIAADVFLIDAFGGTRNVTVNARF